VTGIRSKGKRCGRVCVVVQGREIAQE